MGGDVEVVIGREWEEGGGLTSSDCPGRDSEISVLGEPVIQNVGEEVML